MVDAGVDIPCADNMSLSKLNQFSEVIIYKLTALNFWPQLICLPSSDLF